MSENLALDISDIKVSYNGVTAIENVNLKVSAGETFGLMGLNGAGKTTLIKTILGLRNQDEGTALVLGMNNTDTKSRSNIAFLPERFEPPWFLSGMEFIRFSLNIYKQPFDREKAEQAARDLALDPSVLPRRVQTYSKGMRQKLGLIATILTGCKLLILDEPMSGLDPVARTLVKDMLIKTKQEGQTVFICSHILADMDEICHQAAIMHDRTIQIAGTPAEIKEKAGVNNLERAFLHFVADKKAA